MQIDCAIQAHWAQLTASHGTFRDNAASSNSTSHNSSEKNIAASGERRGGWHQPAGGNNSQCQANRWIWDPDHQVNKLDLLNKLAWGGY